MWTIVQVMEHSQMVNKSEQRPHSLDEILIPISQQSHPSPSSQSSEEGTREKPWHTMSAEQCF